MKDQKQLTPGESEVEERLRSAARTLRRLPNLKVQGYFSTWPTIIAMGFDLELPPIDTAPVPEISITLDNASREIVKHLDAASDSQSKIEVTYRPYLSDDLEGPQMEPPFTLVLTEVSADTSRVTGRARMLDVGNKAFPAETYNSLRFSGLTR